MQNTYEAVQQIGTILVPQVQQQSQLQQIQSHQPLVQPGFVNANPSGNVNVFDCPPSAQQGIFQRQNSSGSEHGFAIPSPAQYVSLRQLCSVVLKIHK